MSTPAEIRAQAAQVLMQVTDDGRSLDVLLENRSGAPQERGLLKSLCYGTVRWYWRLHAVLEQLSAQPLQELQPEVRALALVGLYQLLHTDIAAHAAVAETVEATRILNVGRAAGFLNAILRRCQREAEVVQRRADQDRATRLAHPRWLVEQLQRDWPAQTEAILAANNAHPPFWLRVNTRRISRVDYLEQLRALGITAHSSEVATAALWLPQAMDVTALPGFKEGLISVQDAAAQLAAPLLGCQPGERVLDACAAPGGKTCHILELQPELGELVAVDVVKGRLRRVQSNLERLGLEATVICGDVATAEWWDGQLFDRILLDVPCSATGVIRRHPDIKLLRRATDIAKLAERQCELMATSWAMLKPGGMLLYASCSMLKEENLENVLAFLAEYDDAEDCTAERIAAQPAANGWWQLQPAGADRRAPGLVLQTGRPISSAGTAADSDSAAGGVDGFYYCCLRKRTE